MVLTPEQLKEIELAKSWTLIDEHGRHRQKRKAVNSIALLWPNAEVPYTIDLSIDSSTRILIRQAISHWQNLTCLQFQEYAQNSNIPSGHVRFFKGSGCWSNLGRLISNSAQLISIGFGCEYFGIIVHEIGHAIGFTHEHRRPDRDRYITVHYENITPRRRVHFEKYSVGAVDDMDIPYDLESVMHYGAYAFSRGGGVTITTKDPLQQSKIGQRNGLSFLDAMLANQLYNCNEGCPAKLCLNGSYVGPDCQCVCPHLNSSCESQENLPKPTLPPQCNSVMISQTDDGRTTGEITSTNYPLPYPHNQDCSWTIQVSPGSKIAFIFEDFDVESSMFPDFPCRYDYIALRNSHESLSDAIRYCGSSLPQCFTSVTNEIQVYFHSDFSAARRGFKAWYTPIEPWQTCTSIISGGVDIFEVTTVATSTPSLGECGEILTESEGSFTSPGYPNNYNNNLECQWTVQAPSEYLIKLTFQSFQMQRSSSDSPTCIHDYIEISLGFEWATPARICGGGPTGVIISTSNRMVITFTTDEQFTFQGFYAKYEFIIMQ
ncbi:protein SpAN-like isoform X2 [Ptychodera flava]